MKDSTKLFLTAFTIAGASLISHAAMATANGDGVCSAAETANFECATFGPNVIEFLGSFQSSQCPLSTGATTTCTSYYYRYTGAATNQLNVAIPLRNTQTLKSATCSIDSTPIRRP